MFSNSHEVHPNVFLSREPVTHEDWNHIIELGKERGKPVAVLDLREERYEALRYYAGGCQTIPCPNGWVNLWAPIPDWEFEMMPEFFQALGSSAKALYQSGYILWVHCAAGISRSSSVVVSLLMHLHDWTVDRALEEIRKTRKCVLPNQKFRAALLTLEERLYGQVTSQLVDPVLVGQSLDTDVLDIFLC